jgi:hypothetical protein
MAPNFQSRSVSGRSLTRGIAMKRPQTFPFHINNRIDDGRQDSHCYQERSGEETRTPFGGCDTVPLKRATHCTQAARTASFPSLKHLGTQIMSLSRQRLRRLFTSSTSTRQRSTRMVYRGSGRGCDGNIGDSISDLKSRWERQPNGQSHESRRNRSELRTQSGWSDEHGN